MNQEAYEIGIYTADRSPWNESKAKEMAGCLAIGDRVICYFPEGPSMKNYAEKIKTLLEAK